MDNNLKFYDEKFYSDHLDWQDDYFLVSDWINVNLKGETFGDIGCGNGYIIRNLYINNHKRVWGIDGSKNFMKFVDKAILPFVKIVDLTAKQKLPSADVAICLEVAEHIENKFSDALVENIISTNSKTIMFTAAVLGQEGTHHINLQSHEFWTKKFETKGYFLNRRLSNQFRYDLFDKLKVTKWYLDNMMIFEKKAKSESLTTEELERISQASDQPRVSIVIPCYNMGNFIDDTINSILSQTYKNYEIIIIDDGSNDKNTLMKLIEIKKRLSNINLITQKNAGLSDARNKGISQSRGEYIVCLDSDDVLDSKYLEKLVPILEEDKSNELGFVSPWLQEFGLRNDIWQARGYDPVGLLINNTIVVASLFRKTAWEKARGYKIAMREGYEDWDFWISIVENGYKWVVVPETLFLYRIRENSMLFNAQGEKHIELYNKLMRLHSNLYLKYSLEIIEKNAAIMKELRTEIDNNKKEYLKEIEGLEKKLFLAEEEIKYLKISRLIGSAIHFRDWLRKTEKKLMLIPKKLEYSIADRLDHKTKDRIKYLIRREWLTKKVFVRNKNWSAKEPLVTVVTPTWNRGVVIFQTVNSVLSQTFQNFEYIIVDDGSEEESRAALKTLNNPKIKLIYLKPHKEKHSPAVARNAGIKKARGKYIVCLDDDDWLDPTYLEKALAILETNPNISLVTSYQKMFGAKEGIYKYAPYDPKRFLIDNSVMHAAMFKKEAWKMCGGYKENIGYEDWEYWVNLAENGFWGKLIPEALLNYRVVISSRYTEDLDNHKENIDAIQSLHSNYQQKVRRILKERKHKNLLYNKDNILLNMRSTESYLIPNNKKDNVLIAIPWMTFGGAETLIYNFCKEVSENFNLSFVTGLDSENEWEYKFKETTPYIYHLAHLFENNKDLYLEFISNYIKTRDISVLHIIHTNFMFDILPEIRKRFPKIRIIMTLFNDRVEHFDLAIANQRYINVFSTDNKHVLESYKNKLPKGKSLYCIPNGIDEGELLNPSLFSRSEERQKLGLSDSEIAVFFAGRLSPEKKPDVFIKVARKVTKNNDKIKFFLIGDGVMREDLEKEIERIRSQNLKYLGYQPPEEVARFLSAADIFVLPSIVEGFPLSILEAMSMETAVVASNVGAVNEVIENNKDGFIVRPANVDEISAKIEFFANNKKILTSFSSAARKKIENNYSSKLLGKRYTNLYLGKEN